jgi:cytochrome b subunit of formate dehydrogenase
MKFARAAALLLWIALAASVSTFGQEPVAPTDSTEASTESDSDQAAAADPLMTVPVTGSQIAREEMQCATCHTEPSIWEGDQKRLHIPLDGLQSDAHWQKGVGCSDCHGGDHTNLNYSQAHVGMVSRSELKQRCAVCHKEQHLGLMKGVHAKAGDKDERGRGFPLDCVKCHGASPHQILPASDERSAVYLNNQVRTCGSCHPEDEATYTNTVHGRGLYQSGLKVTAVCADCHRAHDMYYAADRRSSLHPSNVATTCSKCHEALAGRLENSVHGVGGGLLASDPRSEAGGRLHRKPACTDCHGGHQALSPDLAQFRPPVDDSCGNCHSEVYSQYARRMHVRLTDHGYEAAAKCADCHGAHDILPVSNPNSNVAAGENRLQACLQCHVNASVNFAQFNPHADFKNESNFPALHASYEWLRYGLNILFACFFVHAFVWFVRAFVARLQHGGHATFVSNQYALPRFQPLQRAFYASLLVAFLGLTVTGMALKYSGQSWTQNMAGRFGGFRAVAFWHQLFAMVAVVAFAIYAVRAVAGIVRRRREESWKSILIGPDSLVPNGRDVRDFGQMLLWFIGFGRKPGFERWAYWEKLDYWAFFLVSALVGLSGLAFWFPNLFCLVLPGGILNFAKMVHSEFALYAASVLFLIHFYHAHLRPEKFPMDLSVMTGLVSEDHLRKHRPDYLARLEREGKLSEMRQLAPSRRNLWLDIGGGVVVFTVGLCLLAVTLLASLEE